MAKIKVLHVTGAMNRGGAEVMLMDIFRHISAHFQFDFLINYKIKDGNTTGDFDQEILAKGGRIKHIGAQWDLGIKNYFAAFKKVTEELGLPDIVHIHMNAKSGMIALAAKKAGVKKVIVHSHADLKFRGSILSRMASQTELHMQKFLINRYADCFWGCSPEANKSLFYTQFLNENNSAVINNAIDVDSFRNVEDKAVLKLRQIYHLNDNTIVIGNVGRIVAHKNVLFILDILAELEKKNIDFRFVFAGRADQPAYLEEIWAKASEYGITENIIYLGLRSDIPAVLKSCDIFVAPALKEGFGLVAVEAQAAGLDCYLYTGFPTSVDMGVDLVHFFNHFQADVWAEEIKNRSIINKDLDLISKIIINNGFDTKSNVVILQDRYQKLYSK